MSYVSFCIRCNSNFGYIFDTGEICQKCNYKICHKCKVYLKPNNKFYSLFKRKHDENWLCVLCHKYK